MSEDELRELGATEPDYIEYIEWISKYQESTGKQYQNYAATITVGPDGIHRYKQEDYRFKKGESL